MIVKGGFVHVAFALIKRITIDMMTGEGSVKSGTLPQFFVYACLFVNGHRL